MSNRYLYNIGGHVYCVWLHLENGDRLLAAIFAKQPVADTHRDKILKKRKDWGMLKITKITTEPMPLYTDSRAVKHRSSSPEKGEAES